METNSTIPATDDSQNIPDKHRIERVLYSISGGDPMYSCQSRCNCCCSSCNSCSSSCGGEYTTCYCSRYVDVPMCIYYGEGYTEQDSLRSIEQSLSQISRTLCSICRRV